MAGERDERFETAYVEEKARFVARVRSAGRTIEEAEDLVHDVYVETFYRLPKLVGIINLPAWISSRLTRRVIDAWRHDRVTEAAGSCDVGTDTVNEIVAVTGLDPLDSYVRDRLVDALNDAMKALPTAQRRVIEAQVFGCRTFREIAEETGENIDTIKARKRYALQNLARALRHWIEE